MLEQVRGFAAGAVLLASSVTPAAASDLASAKTFLEDLYKGYVKDAPSVDLQSPRFLDASLLDLWRKADKGADGAVVEVDPVCACQDSEVTDVAVTVEPSAAGKAAATVTFKNFDETPTVKFDLVDTPAGWRIADIHDAPPQPPSFRKLFEDAIAAQKKR